MGDAEPTWKERVEKYRKEEEKWKKNPQGGGKVILEIVSEKSVPALEAGLSALIPLAKANALQEHTKDVLCVLFKNIASAKPTMKKMVRAIVEAQAKYNPQIVVVCAMGFIKDKNPKIITETVKTLTDHAFLLKEHLIGSVLGSAQFLFGHSTGSIREEATRLFQILAAEDPERVGEAVKTLRAIQIKEIFQPPAAVIEEIETEKPSTGEQSQASGGQEAAYQINEAPKAEAAVPRSTVQEKRKEIKKKTGKPVEIKEYKVLALPKDFFERFSSSLWKERLVVEELDEALGETGKLGRNESYDVIDAVIKRAGESNNKVFIAGVSVVAKIAYREKIQESYAVQICRAIGKRLKDKKEQVQQAVISMIIEILKMYKTAILTELSNMAVSDKTLRHGVLKTLEDSIEIVGDKEIEDSRAFSALVACTKDQSADIRSLACMCISKVLVKKKEHIPHSDIEEFGIDRLLAAKIEAQMNELFKQKEEEISAIVDSICEDIRNTSIKPSDPATPIRQAHPAESSNICNSPIITQSLKKNRLGVPAQDNAPENVFSEHRPQQQTCYINGSTEEVNSKESGAGCVCKGQAVSSNVCTLMEYITAGHIREETVKEIISMLGKAPEIDKRALMTLSTTHIQEETAVILRDVLQGFEAADTQTAIMTEGLKKKVLKIIGEKTEFEEKCLFATLCDSLIKGDRVTQEEIIKPLMLAEKRSTILQENQAFLIIKVSGEMEYLEVFEILEKVFPISKILSILISMAENGPVFINSIEFLLQRNAVLPNSSIESAISSPRFISLLEKTGTLAARNILAILRKGKPVGVYSPYAKKVRRAEDTVDVNILLNDIIDQNSKQSQDSLERLDTMSIESLSTLLRSASTVVNVLLLQLNDSLTSGGSSLNSGIITRIIRRICESEVFLSSLDAGTLMSLVSDYIVIITGQIPRGTASPDGIRKECGESLFRMCINGPFLVMFKIYINLLSNRCREERTREIIVKLLWKHSKVASSAVSNREIVAGIVSRLNSFYTEYKGDIKGDPLISKVLQLHLIEILKHYGEEFLRIFKVTGPVLTQVRALSGERV